MENTENQKKKPGPKPKNGRTMTERERTLKFRERHDQEIIRGRFEDWDEKTCIMVLGNKKRYGNFQEQAWWRLGQIRGYKQ